MKKLIMIGASLATVVTLAACNGNEVNNNTPPVNGNSDANVETPANNDYLNNDSTGVNENENQSLNETDNNVEVNE